jgi:hypothetical protein
MTVNFSRNSPEIAIEILSPSNSLLELDEKATPSSTVTECRSRSFGSLGGRLALQRASLI